MTMNKMTVRTEAFLDLQRLFVAWCVANGHQDEAEKVGASLPEPGGFHWHDSEWAQEFTASYNKGPFIKVNQDKD